MDRIAEFEGPMMDPFEFFTEYDPQVVENNGDWLGPIIDRASGRLIMSIHSFVLRTEHHTILVDTCVGNGKERPGRPAAHRARTRYLADLAHAGVRSEDVDFVMCTHLHWDHVGWNTRLVDGRWVPTFPNARYVIARSEYDYWNAMHSRGDSSNHSLAFEDSILPLVRAERAVLVKNDIELEDGVWLEPAAGHTPGNVVINVRSEGLEGAFSGDVIHSPLQLLRPDWSTNACWDAEMASACRRAFIERCADTDKLVFPAHFPSPSAGRIVTHRNAFQFANCGKPPRQRRPNRRRSS